MLDLSKVEGARKVVPSAPEIASCPRCGAWSPRNEVRNRTFWERGLDEANLAEVQAGCYLCPRCPPGERWFTLLPSEYQTSGQYSVPAKKMVVELVREFRMSAEAAASLARRFFHLKFLHATTVMEWVREVDDLPLAEERLAQAVMSFSGQLAVDEVYDGKWYVLRATDPVNRFELLWQLGEGSPSEDDVRRFFERLREAGLKPRLVTTDGSNLYPSVIAEVWPKAAQQRCVFHFIKQVNEDLGKAFWVIYHTLPKPPKRGRGRPKKRGRPRQDNVKRGNLRSVRDVRWIVMKNEGNLTDRDGEILERAIALCPQLGVLRSFVVDLHNLFGRTCNSPQEAEQRRQAILASADYASCKPLAKALDRLKDDVLFTKLTRYLEFHNAEKTTNDVERENREQRNRQNSHYRTRSAESLCALLDAIAARTPIPDVPKRLRRRRSAVIPSAAAA